MAIDILGNKFPTHKERLKLLESAYHIIRENGSYEEALAMIDDINDDHLTVFIMAYAFPHRSTLNGVSYIRPIVEAVLGEADNVREHLDDLEEVDYSTLGEYLNHLEILSGSVHLKDAFIRLCSGLDVTAQSIHVFKDTGLPVDSSIEEISINGHTTQRKAALAVQLSLFREFNELMDANIRFLRKGVAS